MEEIPLATSQVTTATRETPDHGTASDTRYISKDLKHQVWLRERGACQQCGGCKKFNYDDVQGQCVHVNWS